MGKVGLNEVQGQGAVSISLDTFREQVNYVNPKNKGYVRFTRAKGTNEVTLGKVNNFCDLFSVSWRTNVDAAHNRALRDQMVNAIKGDLAFVDGASRDKILNLIRSGNIIEKKVANGKNAGVGETSTKALARRELKALFEEFDKVYNTREGRKNIVTRMLCKSLEGLIPITENQDTNYKTACDYLENVLKIKLTLLDPPLSENDGIPDAENPNHRLISEAAFRAALGHAQRTIETKKKQHANAVHIVDSFVQCFALNGDLMDYTLPDKLKMDPERLDRWTQTLETLIADNQKKEGGLKLSERDFALLKCKTAAIGTPTFLRMYIQEVLGYRLKSLYNTFAAKLRQPGNEKYRDELMGLLQNQKENGSMSRGDFDRFQLALGKLLGSKGKPFDLYQTILDDAIKFSGEVYEVTRDFVDAETSKDDEDMLKKGFPETKSGKTFRNLRMSKAVNGHIVEKLKANGVGADKINDFLSAVQDNGYAIAYEVEAYHATAEYCAREFGLSESTNYENQLTDRWAEELKRLDTATNLAYEGGGLGQFCSKAMDIVFSNNAGGIVEQLHVDWKLDKEEIQDIMGSDLFKQARNLTMTQLMSNIGNSEEVKELLSGANANKAAYQLSRTTMLVYHEFLAAKGAIADQVKEYSAQLMSMKGSGDMTREKIKEMVQAYRQSCESKVLQAVRQYLSEVKLKASDTFLDIMSQGRTRKTFWEKAEDFLGLSSFSEDLATPKLEKMIANGLAAADAEGQLEFDEKRLELTKVPQDANAVKPNHLRFDKLLEAVEKTVQGEEMPTLFSIPEDKAEALNTLREAVLMQTYVDVFKEHQNTNFFTQSLIDTKSRQLDQKKAVVFKDKFQTKAKDAFAQFKTYQDTFVRTLRNRLTDAVGKLATEKLSNAKPEDVAPLTERIVNDLIARGVGNIREALLAKIRLSRAIPVIKEGQEPDDFNSAVDEIGQRLCGLYASKALEERGKMVLDVLNDVKFAEAVCPKTVEFLEGKKLLVYNNGVEVRPSIARRALLPVYAQLEKEIRACPALWSIKGKDGVAELILERLSSNEIVERIHKYDDVYRKTGQFFFSKKNQVEYANSLPLEYFDKIWMRVVNEKLPAVTSTADITLEHALDLVKADVKVLVDKVAQKLGDFLNAVSDKYDTNLMVGDGTVVGQLKLFVDELFHGESSKDPDAAMSKNFVDKMAARYPLFEKLVTSGVQARLVGKKADLNLMAPDADAKAEGGTLRRRVFTELLNVVITDFLENTQDEVEALKNEAIGTGREKVVAAVVNEKQDDALSETLDSLLQKKASQPRLREYGAGILEGISQQANTLLEEYVSDESIIAGLADRVEAMEVPDEEKAQMLGVMRHVKDQLEQERKIEQEAEQKVAIFQLELDLETAEPNERAKIEERLDKAKRGALKDEEVREIANRYGAKWAYTVQNEYGKLQGECRQLQVECSKLNAKKPHLAVIEKTQLEELEGKLKTLETKLEELKEQLEDCRKGSPFVPEDFTSERYDAAIGLKRSDALIQLRHHLSDEFNLSEVYEERQKAVASAFTLGFELFAKTPMTTVVDGKEVLKEEFKADRDNIIGYRDRMQTKLLDWWRTNMTLEVTACDVRAAMINLDAQLDLKGINPAVAQTVRETVADELKAMREKVADRAGDVVNKAVKDTLEGVTVGGLNEKIDAILWVVANEKLAAEYVPFVEKKESEIFYQLIDQKEYEALGFTTGVLQEVKDIYLSEMQDKIGKFRAESRHELMKEFGFINKDGKETQTFSDQVKMLAMLRSSKEEVVKRVVERLRKDFMPRLNAEVDDERAWLRRLNEAAQDWMLQIVETLFGNKINFPAVGKEGEAGYMPAMTCKDWLKEMSSFNEADETIQLPNVFGHLLQAIIARYSSNKMAGEEVKHLKEENLDQLKLKKGGWFSDTVTWRDLELSMMSLLSTKGGAFLAGLHGKYKGVLEEKSSSGVRYTAGQVDPKEVASYIQNQNPVSPEKAKTDDVWNFGITYKDNEETKTVKMKALRQAFEKLAEKLVEYENDRRKALFKAQSGNQH